MIFYQSSFKVQLDPWGNSLQSKKCISTYWRSSVWKTRQENPPAGSSVTETNAPFQTGVSHLLSLQAVVGKRGKLIKGRSMVRRCFRSFGNLSSLLGCNTNAHSRGKNGKGTKTGFATRKFGPFFWDNWCESNSRCDVFSSLHVSDVVL